jgi:asparagine N-glycosylation enzyme membrane subunit Stt3
MSLVALLRHGLLLSLGWLVAGALALGHYGFLWAFLLILIWAVLMLRFQRATVAHAQAIAARLKGETTGT